MSETTPLGSLPPLAACRSEEGAAALNDVPHILGLQFPHILFEEPMVAVVDAPDFHALVERRTCNRTCRRIHSRAVSPTCHDCNAL